MNKPDQLYVMNTAKLEISVAEGIKLEDLVVRESVRNDGTWVVVQKSTKKVWFRKRFK